MCTSARRTIKRFRLWPGIIPAALGTWLVPAPPIAAQQPTVLQEVIVTATKRATRLQDVPVAVSALTVDDVTARGLTQYADYLSTVPGVYFDDGGPGVSQIRIRGLSAGEAGVPSTVATYFGESLTSVRTNGGGKPNLRLVDIDRIEVLRGPQGTLFGANALAGVVRIIPAAPDLAQFSTGASVRGWSTAHASDESYHVDAMVNVPFVTDRFAVRLVGYLDDVAGFVDNQFAGRAAVDYTPIGELLLGLPPGALPPGTLQTPSIAAFSQRDVNSEDTWGVRAAAMWRVTDQFRLDLALTRQQVTLNSEPFTTPQAGEYVQVRGADVFEPGEYGEDIDLASLTARYDWSGASLVSVTSWSKMIRTDLQDITFLPAVQLGTPIPWTLRNRSRGEMRTQEVRLESRSEGPFDWIVGLFYLDEEAEGLQLVRDFSCPNCFPNFLGQDFALRGGGSFGEDQHAVFGEVSYDFASRWTLGVGARWLEEEVFIEFGEFDGFLAPPDSDFRSENSTSEFNPSAYLQFRPLETATLYLQAARGFRSATANQELPAACAAEAAAVGLRPISDPDTLWNYELGAKSSVASGRLNVNLAVYRADWEGVQLGSSLACGFNGSLNGGDVRGHGVELEVIAQPTASWRFNLSGSFNNNEFERVQPATGFQPGERVPGAPRKNFNLGAQYGFAAGPRWRGFARADYGYVGDVRIVFVGQPNSFLDSYDTINARIGLHSDKLAIDLYGRNLADERAVVSQNDPQFGGTQVLMRPREVGIELRYTYR